MSAVAKRMCERQAALQFIGSRTAAGGLATLRQLTSSVLVAMAGQRPAPERQATVPSAQERSPTNVRSTARKPPSPTGWSGGAADVEADVVGGVEDGCVGPELTDVGGAVGLEVGADTDTGGAAGSLLPPPPATR